MTGTPKQALRRRLRQARRERAAASSAADRAAAGDALAAAAVALVAAVAGEVAAGAAGQPGAGRPGCRVAAYESTAVEPPTEALRDRLRALGHEVLLPITLPDLRLDWRLDGTDAPLGLDALATCQVVLTPGLAVDGSGTRLGQGGGCYDRALPHVRPGVPVVTVLWDEELLAEPVPREPHDRRVDAVLTPGSGLVRLTPTQ